MPPEEELQPSQIQRLTMVAWIDDALTQAKTRVRPKNGGTRRLTVSQYRNTLKDLLGIEEDLTGTPPDAKSRTDSKQRGIDVVITTLIETYFEIAERALDLAIFEPEKKPVFSPFADLGNKINPNHVQTS